MTLDDHIREIVLESISKNGRKLSCKLLDISERTLRNYLHKWGRVDLLDCSRIKKDKLIFKNPTFKERKKWHKKKKSNHLQKNKSKNP